MRVQRADSHLGFFTQIHCRANQERAGEIHSGGEAKENLKDGGRGSRSHLVDAGLVGAVVVERLRGHARVLHEHRIKRRQELRHPRTLPRRILGRAPNRQLGMAAPPPRMEMTFKTAFLR